MSSLAFLLLLTVLAAVAAAVLGVVGYFSTDKREIRAERKNANRVLAARTRQLALAKSALIKIAANDCGNPSLEATLALENVQSVELKELES